MSVIDLDSLLTELSADAPAGADVEYDPEYFELEKLAQGTPESSMGEATKEAEEPAWNEVKEASLKLFERTRDLRVAMILAAALLQEDGLEGFVDGAQLIRGFIEKLWEQFYPKLDPDDNNDPTFRINILKGFDGDNSSADLYKFKQRLREAVLTNSQQRIGKFSMRDILVARGEIQPAAAKDGESEPTPPDMNLINAAFEDTTVEDLQATQSRISGLTEAFEGIDSLLAEKIGGGIGPDFTPIKDVLGQLKGVLDDQLSRRGIGDVPVVSEDGASSSESTGEAPAFSGGRGISGEISSRNDVIKMLDKICDYYTRYEPASPIPIFMTRAKRLVNMNFVDLIKDLTPEAMAKIEVFTGESSAPAE